MGVIIGKGDKNKSRTHLREEAAISNLNSTPLGIYSVASTCFEASLYLNFSIVEMRPSRVSCRPFIWKTKNVKFSDQIDYQFSMCMMEHEDLDSMQELKHLRKNCIVSHDD